MPSAATSESPDFPSPLLDLRDGERLKMPLMFGHFRIHALARKSNMSVVAEGTHTATGGKVAVKICLPSASRERFLREIEHAKECAGIPGVVKIDERDTGFTKEGLPFHATPWIEGPSLDAFFLDAAQSLESKLDKVEELARIVGQFHKKGLSHRDLKPSNVIVEEGQWVRLLDLGLARSEARTDLTRTGEVAGGTPGYRPPWSLSNPALSRDHEKRWDVYSLAVILIGALAGTVPDGDLDARFTAAGVKRLLAEKVRGDRRFDGLLEKCLSARPEDCQQDAGAFYSALRQARRKSGVRHRSVLATAVLSAVLIGSALYAWREFRMGCFEAFAGWFGDAPGETGTNEPSAPPAQTIAAPSLPERSAEIIENPSITNRVVRLQITPAGATVHLVNHRDNGRVVAEEIVPESGALDLDVPDSPGAEYGLIVFKTGFHPNTQAIRPDSGPLAIDLERLRGEVEFKTSPGARVMLRAETGGLREFGPVPSRGVLRAQSLEEGDWTYQIDLADHEPASGKITGLVHGRLRTFDQPLKPLPGRLSVAGHATLEIWSGGSRLGAANTWIPLAAGTHELELRRKEFRSERMSVVIPPNRDISRVAPSLVAEVPRLPAYLVEVADAKPAPLTGLNSGSREAQKLQLTAARTANMPLEVRTAKAGIVFRYIPPGSFEMGSPPSETGRYSNEVQHPVTLSQGFLAGKFEVTQGQWRAVMGGNPSHFSAAGDKAPVEDVSWDYVQQFLEKLAAFEGAPLGAFRLLTEAEWEWSCRAGTTAANYGPLADIAWLSENSGSATHPVGQKLANAFGLHDMSGNVWEWCSDWYGEYSQGAVSDPVGASSGSNRVFRGGSWIGGARYCRSAIRNRFGPGCRSFNLGFRLALRPVQER